MGNNTSLQVTAPPPTENIARTADSSLAIPPPPTTTVTQETPVPSIPAPGVPEQPKQPEVASELVNNPGTYEELHKACKDVFPQPFEGGRLVIGKGVSSHFQINHTLTLGSPMVSGYRFGATYVGCKQFSPQESYPVLLGDIDASGNLNANIIHAFSRKIFTRFVAQFQGDKTNTQMVTDYKGSSYSASVTVANPDLLNGSGLAVGQLLQKITPSVDIGAECMYQRGGHIPGGQVAVMSMAGRVKGEKWQAATTLCPAGPGGGGLHASYCHRINDTLQIGAEFETSIGMGESTATVGYQLEIPSAGVNFKGQIDSNWTLAAVMEKKLLESQIPITVTLSAIGSQVKSDYKFGIGMNVG